MKEQDVIRSVYLKEKTVAETANEMDVSTAYVYRLENAESTAFAVCFPS